MADGDGESRPDEQRAAAGASSSQRHPRRWPDDDNPFVAFRRYADEQIASVLQGIMGLPSLVSQPLTERWMVFTENESGNGIARQRHAEEDARTYRSAERDSRLDDSERKRRWSSHSPDSSDELHFDVSFDGRWLNDHFPFRFFSPIQRLFNLESLADADGPMWPMTYIMFSPYSPLHLESQTRPRSQRDRGIFTSLMSSLAAPSEPDSAEPRWREAFEDLLRLENGQPLLKRTSQDLEKRQTGGEWLRSMIERGSLGDHWKSVPGNDAMSWPGVTLQTEYTLPEPPKEQSDANDQEQPQPDQSATETELDMYDRFLQDMEAREHEFFRGLHKSPLIRFLLEERRRHQDQLTGYERRLQVPEEENRPDDTENWLELVSGGSRKSVQDTTSAGTGALEDSTLPRYSSEAIQSRVVSTTTTTEKVTLSDGSIKTRTVQKKRFADGREESNESVQIVNPENPRDARHPSKQELDAPSANAKSKGGWFWRD